MIRKLQTVKQCLHYFTVAEPLIFRQNDCKPDFQLKKGAVLMNSP